VIQLRNPLVLGALAVAEVVDLFLKWAPRHGPGADIGISGLNVPVGSWVLTAAVVLFVWQLARCLRVSLTARADTTVAALLALTTGLLGGCAVLNLSSASSFSVGTNLGYGAFLQIVISIALAAAGLVLLRDT
jgi:hypothetical protein